MNYEDCLRQNIQEAVGDVLKRLPHLSPPDRYSLLMEHFEDVCFEFDAEDVLIVPNLEVHQEV